MRKRGILLEGGTIVVVSVVLVSAAGRRLEGGILAGVKPGDFPID
jgi:hypothetical protein